MTRPQLHAIRWATAATIAAIGGILAAGVLAGALAASVVLLAWLAWRRARVRCLPGALRLPSGGRSRKLREQTHAVLFGRRRSSWKNRRTEPSGSGWLAQQDGLGD